MLIKINFKGTGTINNKEVSLTILGMGGLALGHTNNSPDSNSPDKYKIFPAFQRFF